MNGYIFLDATCVKSVSCFSELGAFFGVCVYCGLSQPTQKLEAPTLEQYMAT